MGNKSEGFKKGAKWVWKMLTSVVDFICSFLEMHLVKIVAFSIMCLCCLTVNALHMIVVVMMLLCLVFGISALQFSFSFIGPYLSILFLSKMAYQTKFVPDLTQEVNCSTVNTSFHMTIANTILDPEWWGYNTLEKNEKLITHYKGYVLVFLVMTLQAVIRTRQKIIRLDAGLPPQVPDVMFLKTTRTDADKSLRNCFKFFINYGFYKFGVEVTLSYCVFVIGYREDAFSVLYAIWVFILILPKRTTLSIMWPFYFTTVLFSILWQYSMAVGLSKKTCFVYPWANQDSLIKWMFLPNFKYKPNTKKTLVDFVLLLLIQRQQLVFDLEKRFGDRYHGGSNKEEFKSYKNPDFVNPTPDHTVGMKSWIDLAKLVCMTWWFRLTLVFLFWNGASNVNVLSLGYLVAAFIFLWIDYDFCLWPIEKILRWWNTLLAFTACVVLVKAVHEFLGCIYGNYLKENLSFLVGLFWVHCCAESASESGHGFDWDVVCFIWIIFQKRYFKSCYFLHQVDDVSGIFQLRAQGAKLMDELHELRLMEFQERERKTLLKIKKDMNRIKAWQKRMQGLNYNEPRDHATAIYMGDYFMFEETSTKMSGSEENSEVKTEEEKENDINNDGTDKELTRAGRSLLEVVSSGTELEAGEDKKEKKKCSFRGFVLKVMVYLIRFFNKYSEDYRYIQSVIERERKKRKMRAEQEVKSSQTVAKAPQEPTIDAEVEDKESNSKTHQKLLVQMLIASAKFFMSKTEFLCYLSIFIHTVLSPNLISLALPLMLFLWGSLTSTRPTTTFWTVLIAYTEVMVVIKAIFQNSVFPWNKSVKRPSHYESPPLFMGIHKDNRFVLADLFLLILLFLHRYKLKTLGLWNRTHEEETVPPQDLYVYKELSNENDLREVKGNRSLVYQRKLLMNTSDLNSSVTTSPQMALWKCTSRSTAKYMYRGDRIKAKIRVKEIEGEILVTYDGRRLQPAHIHISQMPEEDLEGSVVLRVYYAHDVVLEEKSLPLRLSWIQHFTCLRKFFLQILVRDWRVSYDFYTLMFVFQFLNFLIIFFGYSSFANPDDIQSEDYFSLIENQVPPMYLFTVISHFLVIIIDRILYLRKCVIGKLILHLILVTLIHIWMFILIPIVTEGSFSRSWIRQAYYLISCMYFLMSAYQLRVGYPMRVQGHFLSKKYGYVNYLAYKGSAKAKEQMALWNFVLFTSTASILCVFKLIYSLQLLPFFNQLRTLLDYLCIHTSLSMVEWIKMESIFEVVFENKCSRRADEEYPSARGEECPKLSKYCPGVLSFVALVVVIWIPFIIFAVFNTVAQPNLPQEASLEIHIGNFGNVYTTVATFDHIITFSEGQYKTLQKIYKYNKKLWTFLSLYDNRDVGVLKFNMEPFKPWSVTPKELALLNETIQNLDLPITIYIIWRVQRIPRSQMVATARGYRKTVLHKQDKARSQLAEAFLKMGNKVRLTHVLPKFIHVTNEGKAKPLSGFLSPSKVSYRNVTITLAEEDPYLWWKLEELADDPNENRINKIPFQNSREVTIYTFNERSTPKLLLNVRKKGIIGLYLSIVLVLWTFVRRTMVKYPRLMFEEMPNPDPVLQLCHDIYLARESHEFALEEDLYAKLLFLFRSPETMIKVTRLTNVETRMEQA